MDESRSFRLCDSWSGQGGGRAGAGGEGKGGTSAPKCTYTKLVPQPPANDLAMQDGKKQDGKKQGGKGAVY